MEINGPAAVSGPFANQICHLICNIRHELAIAGTTHLQHPPWTVDRWHHLTCNICHGQLIVGTTSPATSTMGS
jgi:hypothetical protein